MNLQMLQQRFALNEEETGLADRTIKKLYEWLTESEVERAVTLWFAGRGLAASGELEEALSALKVSAESPLGRGLANAVLAKAIEAEKETTGEVSATLVAAAYPIIRQSIDQALVFRAAEIVTRNLADLSPIGAGAGDPDPVETERELQWYRWKGAAEKDDLPFDASKVMSRIISLPETEATWPPSNDCHHYVSQLIKALPDEAVHTGEAISWLEPEGVDLVKKFWPWVEGRSEGSVVPREFAIRVWIMKTIYSTEDI